VGFLSAVFIVILDFLINPVGCGDDNTPYKPSSIRDGIFYFKPIKTQIFCGDVIPLVVVVDE